MSQAMISLLRLKNAQRHINAVFEFVAGVNVIRGSTDAGKSTVLRSLRWVCFNKPAKLNILRRGTSRTEVEIVFDGHTVCRARTKSKNLYYLDGREKRGFGKNNVPDDIAKLLNMDDRLHLQRQSDPYFLLAVNSPTERAKELERFTDLSIITRSIQKGRKTVRGIEARGEGLRAYRRDRRREGKRLAAFFSQKDCIILVFSLSKELEEQRQRIAALKEKQSIMQRLSNDLSRAEPAAAIDTDALGREVTEYTREQGRCERLRELRRSLLELTRNRTHLKTVIDQLELDTLQHDITEYAQQEERLRLLRQMREHLVILSERCTELQREEKEASALIGKIKVCKTCGRPIDETTIRGNR